MPRSFLIIKQDGKGSISLIYKKTKTKKPYVEEKVLSDDIHAQAIGKDDFQPYFKLHGSCNWKTQLGTLVIFGGNKRETIQGHKLLTYNIDRFREYMLRPRTRLMTIGYSFSDDHINEIIAQSPIDLFVIDPSGSDLLSGTKIRSDSEGIDFGKRFPDPNHPLEIIKDKVIGASRRSLREIFGQDHIEHAKVMRFFSNA